ncbi:MAG: nucleoside hydrolase [Thermomicrobiales bacterium]|nr:nucleoside hydrolase [Thermomicrobiales bacterium]
MTGPTPLILDVDTGTDDALALAYAHANPRIELLAATTVAGNIGVDLATANTLAVLDALGASDVPVHQGASHPLVRPHRDAVYFHHENGMGGATLPASQRAIGPDRGPAAIIRLAKQRPGEITLVCLGPLTNLAIALNVEPGLTDLLAGVALMGGAFNVPGNTTPAAEFNILVDPEAAEQVFAAPFKRLVAVGLDVTEQVRLTTADWKHAVDHAATLPPTAALLGEVGRFAYGELGRDSFALHDPLAVASALQPDLISREEAAIVVDTRDGEHLGRTRIAGPGRVEVATAVDVERALRDFRETVGLPS